jgi:uncharacterized protein DUF6894
MPRYFFDISNGHPFKDPTGEELQDDNAAWLEALMTARDIETNLHFDDEKAWSVEVKREETSATTTSNASRLRPRMGSD